MLKNLARWIAREATDIPSRERSTILMHLTLWTIAFLVIYLAITPRMAAAGVYYRSGGEAPTRIAVQFEPTCSFNVVTLPAGTYVSEENVAEKLRGLWTDANARSKNIWLYGHRSGECKAASGAVGYRFTWTTATLDQVRKALTGTGRISTAMVGGRLRLNVSAPVWLSGDIANAVQFSRSR